MTEPTHDVFISYSSKDTWVRCWLLPELEAAGLSVLIDFRDFEIGVPALVNIGNAVERSRNTLAVLSPNWLAFQWAIFEALMVQSSDPTGLRQKFIPLLLVDCDLPPRIAMITYADFRNPSNHTEELARLIAQLKRSKPVSSKHTPLLLTTEDTLFPDGPEPLPFCIKQFHIKNFQAIRDQHISAIPVNARWIFLLGGNGSGKTSLLQALAVGLYGNADIDIDDVSENRSCEVEIEFRYHGINPAGKVIDQFYWNETHWNPVSKPSGLITYGPSRLVRRARDDGEIMGPTQSIHSEYAKYRNIHLWMKDRSLEANSGDSLAGDKLERVKSLLVELMPNVTEIQIEGSQIRYLEEGRLIPSHHLSAGHKSILAMIGDMLMRLMEAQPEVTAPEDLFGVVLIDELEVHLHPDWQVRLPGLLSKVFPKVQFIASTHSVLPLIGAPAETVFLKIDHTAETGTRIQRIELDVTKLTPNTILTSEFFGMDSILNPRMNADELRTENHYWEIEDREKRMALLRRLSERNIIPSDDAEEAS
ncbi:MAG: AAA family ATPase [Acidobacteriota bacterium]|nr:AAA family ATPase [Acidobacteriota bacterium]